MSFRPTAKDEKILSYICQNFLCKICNSILIQCVTLSCGHQYCSYCLDMLTGGKSNQPCPQCCAPIKYAQPNDAVDQKIDNFIHSCSKPIHKSYTVALNARFQKSLERSKSKQDARLQQHQQSLQNDDSKVCTSFDEICKTLRKSSSRNSLSEQRCGSASKKRSKESLRNFEVDVDNDKVNSLFGIYDHFLQIDNEPEKDMAGGDFTRENDVVKQETPESIELHGLRNFTKRSDIELASLIKETDDIVRLDEHIQQWTDRMKSALGGISLDEPSSDQNQQKDNGLYQHNIDDDLWKSSNHLLSRLRNMQEQRKTIPSPVSTFPGLPPAPRSAKLDLDTVSDDSDVEEYEEDLNSLQKCLDTSVPKVPDGSKEQEQMFGSESAPASRQPSVPNVIASRSSSTTNRRMTRMDSLNESGHTYLKENMQFVSQIRKYKDALLKIQNKKVDTAQEIKELIPARVRNFENSPNRSTPLTRKKSGNGISKTPPPRNSNQKQARPRIHQLPPVKAALQQQSKPRSKNSFPSRLPSASSIQSRPRTAVYEIPPPLSASSTSSTSYQQQQQLLQKQGIDNPTKIYSMKRSRGNRNTLNTAHY